MKKKSPCSSKEEKNLGFHRKAFVQIIEVAIAALLIVLVLPVFFGWLNVKQDWARHDLIVSGNGIIGSLEASGKMAQIFSDTQGFIKDMETVKPANVKYSIYVEGLPKAKARIACVSCSDAQLSYVKTMLKPAFFGNRIINFTVENIDLDSLPSIPTGYDAAIFLDYSNADWTAQKAKISGFLAEGKGIIAIQAATNRIDFLEIFNLIYPAGGTVSGYYNFTRYSKIEKYFLAFGFDVATADDGTGVYRGDWYIWETPIQISTTGSSIGIEGIGVKTEGETFSLPGPDTKYYSFKVKKIWADKSGAIIQPVNKTFIFRNFWDAGEKKVTGNNILTGDQPLTYSLMTNNGTAVWISDFPYSDEYITLVKAAAASVLDEKGFYLVSPLNVKNSVSVNTFITPCCDAPAAVKLTLSLWYVY